MSGRRYGGCYVWRTRKPHAPVGLPIIGRHWGYVGQTSSYIHRSDQHLNGSRVYGRLPAPWSDLDPKCYKVPTLLWRWKRAREAQEALLIWLLLPVYNDKLNHANPRRIKIGSARAQRAVRDRQCLPVNVGRMVLRATINLVLLSLAGYVSWAGWLH